MARNRFETYQNNEYTSQFVPTPMDANLMLGAIGQRQKSFDGAMDEASMFAAEVDYYHNDREIAEGILGKYDTQSNSIAEGLYQDGDGTGAARSIIKLKRNYNKDKQVGEIAALKRRKAQFDADMERIDNIKSPVDREEVKALYMKNVHTDFGIDSPLNQAKIFDDPGLAEKALAIGKAIKADGIPMGDGRLYASADGMHYTFVNGVQTKVDPTQAYETIKQNILADPQTRGYIQARLNAGAPVDYENLIASVANAVGFTDTRLTYGFRDNSKGLIDYEQGNRPFSMAPANPYEVVQGMTIQELNKEIETATGTRKNILEGFKETKTKEFDNSEAGKSLKPNKQDVNNFKTEFIDSLDDFPKQTTSDASYIKNLKEIFINMSNGELHDLITNTNDSELQQIVSENVGEGWGVIFTDKLKELSELTSVGEKTKFYNDSLDEVLGKGFQSTPIEIRPSMGGVAKRDYLSTLKQSLNTNEWDVLEVYNSKEGTYANVDPNNYKQAKEELSKLKAGDIELQGVDKFGESYLPPHFKINLTTGKGEDAIITTYTISPKLNPELKGSYSLDPTIHKLIKDLDITGDKTSTAVENDLLLELQLSDIGFGDTGNSNFDGVEVMGINDSPVKVNPYTKTDSNGKNGNFITVDEPGYGKYEITVEELRDMYAFLEGPIKDLTTEEKFAAASEYDEFQKVTKGLKKTDIVDFSKLLELDPKAMENIFIGVVAPFIQKNK
jgi:hypothetical protein